MRIVRIIFENTKFFSGQTFSFCDSKLINTVSGKNGSGKTTLFSIITLIERAYFLKLMIETGEQGIEAYSDSVKKDIARLLGTNDSKTTLELHMGSVEEERDPIIKIDLLCKCDRKQIVSWRVDIDSEDEKMLSKAWNLANPTDLIILASAERKVYEKDYDYESIQISAASKVSPKVSVVMNCENLYDNLYRIVINDYIHERIIPSNGKRTKYIDKSKKTFSGLVSDISISNFSGINKDRQFILQARKGNSKAYDIRDFSSGEKLIWYSLLLLNYTKDLGVLIIDEPENHLHESLAWKFIMYLKSICESTDSELSLSQVFLLTHSKSIIYNVFSLGENYCIQNKSLQHLEFENYESVLRKIGVSFINEKIIFVEGDTDIDLLDKMLTPYNITIRQLNNCQEIIDTFEGLQKVSEYVQDKSFLFLIDRDLRDDNEIDLISKRNTQYFEEHFYVLDRHELENYYLDEKTIYEALNPLVQATGASDFSVEIVEEFLKCAVDETNGQAKKKYLNHLLHIKLHHMDSLIKMKEIRIEDNECYSKYIDDLFHSDKWNEATCEMKDKYRIMEEKFSSDNWANHWKQLCDGKMAFGNFASMIGGKYGIKGSVIINRIRDESIKNKKSDIYSLVRDIVNKLGIEMVE